MNPSPPKQETGVADLFAVEQAETGRLAHGATTIPVSAVVFMTTSALAAVAFFTFGLVSFRALPAFRRLVANVEDIRVPILAPVTLAEIARELLRAR